MAKASRPINESNRSLSQYLEEIGKYEPLHPSREVELALAIKKGDRLAMKELVEANLRFVVSVAKDYQGQGLPLTDLINEGNMGLMKAAGRFDETRGFKFISYAVWWIRQSILQALAEHSRIVRLPLNRVGTISKITKQAGRFDETRGFKFISYAVWWIRQSILQALAEHSRIVRLPLNRVGTISKITKQAERLESEIERSPNEEEIGRNLEMTSDEVIDAMRISRRHHSLNAPFRDGDKNSLIDVIKDDGQIHPDEPLMAESLKDEIRQSLDTLKERERQVIKMYFGIDRDYALTLNEIGEEFNLTRERVRQIKEKAIRRLRHRSRSKSLRTYLG